jgi:GTPase
MFFDEVSLGLSGGHGGNGMLSFHREKFIAYGPPDGGDGGRGGNVVLKVDGNLNTFRHFAGRKNFSADKGGDGHKNNKTGGTGEDLILKVPVGTLVYEERVDEHGNVLGLGEKLVDLKEDGQEFVVAEGGRGGQGNASFVSSVRQAPKFAELGDIGEERHVRLEMQLVGDVGLLGFPSAGKSTLISHVSSAKPKIGDYPFTTLTPNLGVVYLSEFGGSQDQSFVIADMPGIIEGASEGKGLGDTFLKHISRSAVLIYLIDPFSYDDRNVSEQYRILRDELKKYQREGMEGSLADKDFLIVMNKIDAIPDEDREELKAALLKDFPEVADKFRMASGVSGEGLDSLMFDIWNLVQKYRREEADALAISDATEAEDDFADGEIHEYTPIKFVDEKSFDVQEMYEIKAEGFQSPVWGQLISAEARPERKLFKVEGARIQQISRMTNTEQPDAIQRVYAVMDKMGIQDELRRAGAVTGDYVKIDMHFFEFHDLTS